MKKTINIISIILSVLMLASVFTANAAQTGEKVGEVTSVNTFITAPKSGDTPNLSVTKDNNDCEFVTSVYAPHGTGLEFSVERDGSHFYMKPTDFFEAGVTYTAMVFLKVTDNAFSDDLTVTINGRKADIYKINSGIIYATCDFTVDGAGYYVIGPKEVFGAAGWDIIGRNELKKDSGDIYSATFSVSKAFETIPIKVAKLENGVKTEYGMDGTDYKYYFGMSAAGSFTVSFDLKTKAISVTGSNVTAAKPDYSYIAVAGNGMQSGFLNNEIWNSDTLTNQMRFVSTDVWEITYRNVKPGKGYSFLFLADGLWENSFGGTYTRNGAETKADFRGSNIKFDVNTESDVTLRLDLRNFDYDTKKSTFTVTIKPLGFVPGDITGDGVVNINDATAVQRYLAKSVVLNDDQLKAADADGNGTININDATAIQKYVARLINQLG